MADRPAQARRAAKSAPKKTAAKKTTSKKTTAPRDATKLFPTIAAFDEIAAQLS